MMQAKDLAAALNGIEHSTTLYLPSCGLMQQAEAAGLVVAYCSRDDLLVDGAFRELVGAPGVALIDAKGALPAFDSAVADEESCRRYFERKAKARAIEAIWTIQTNIPHETFSVVEDGKLFCRGIVFALADLVTTQATPTAHAPANCSETAVTTYSYSVDDESFLGEFDSPEAAAEAGFCDDPELQVISVAENCKDTAHRYVSADYILEDAAGRAYDECGEAADDWLDGLMHNLDKKAELERIVGDWLQTQEPPKFSRVKNPRAVTRAEMIAAGKLAADQA